MDTEKNRRMPRGFFPLVIILLELALLLAPAGFPSAGAQPLEPGATINVSSPYDNNNADNDLTLREAILIAVGGTGPSGTNRPLTNAEASLTYCTFDVNLNIIGNCGAGRDDIIRFQNTASNILLTADLPPLSDNAMDTISGMVGTIMVTINGLGVTHGFNLTAGRSIVQRMTLRNMVGYGVKVEPTVTGSLIYNLTILDIAGDGIVINGGSGHNIISNMVGAADTLQPCLHGASGSGIVLAGATTGDTLSDNLVRCNAQYGVLLDGIGTSSNVIMSTSTTFAISNNTLDGIREQNGAASNSWSQVSIYDNGGLGISKADQTLAPAPVLSHLSLHAPGWILMGTGLPGSSVEAYRAAVDPSLAGEGKTYLLSAIVDQNGNWSAYVTGADGDCFTAFQTVGSESSEFGANRCVFTIQQMVFLPSIVR